MHHKELQEYQDDTDEFNQLTRFIPYNPTFHNYVTKYVQKSQLINIKSEEFLPTLMLNEKLQHKIKYHKTFKQAFGLTNILQFETTIQVDLISYDFEDGYTRKLERDEQFSIMLLFESDSRLKTLSEFMQSKGCTYESTNMDLLYLNLFRIAIYTHKNKITTLCYYPSIEFSLQEIKQPAKFVETPLTKMITRSGQSSQKKDKVQYKFGFLSLDQSNRILPLMGQDPLVREIPLIGSWIYSNDAYDDPLSKRWIIWAMLTEYIVGHKIKQRICKDNSDRFLFIQFQKNQNPVFFEVQIEEDPQYKMVRCQDIYLNTNVIDIPAAMPISYIQRPSDILSEIRPQETSFYQDSVCKQLPVPIPQVSLMDHNISLSSAHFAQQSQHESHDHQPKKSETESMAEKLVLLQAEQLRMMQNQILDLQKTVLLQQQQQQEQARVATEHQFFKQSQMLPQYMTFIHERESFNQTKQEPEKIINQRLSQFHTQTPTSEIKVEKNQQSSSFPIQKIDFLSEQIQLRTQSRKKEQELEDIVSQFVDDNPISNYQPQKMIYESPHTKIQNDHKPQLSSLMKSTTELQSQKYKINLKTENDKENNLKYNLYKEKQCEDKENIDANIKQKSQTTNIIPSSSSLNQSYGSKMMPKIKFNLKDNDDSDSDVEIKRLEQKYLKRRY